ncbi:MAG TPA: hypothetical protein VHE61_24355 [Opitutaceae bacterium]|nr:hypothetical protein [Opitutaceae bacterium]
MRRPVKVKAANRLVLHKTPTVASAAARRSFPAWIDAGEGPVALSAARRAKPRVRDGLVLRQVTKRKSSERSVSDAPRAR